MNWKEARVVDTSVPMSKLQQHQLHARLCFARTLLHECMPRPAGVRLQVQAARRNIVGVQRHASLVTSTIGPVRPVKITHCDQRKRHVGISNILNQTNYSNELDGKRTSEYSVNSFEYYWGPRKDVLTNRNYVVKEENSKFLKTPKFQK